MTKVNKTKNSKDGYFGSFGGRYVPETLMPAIILLEDAFNKQDILIAKKIIDSRQ